MTNSLDPKLSNSAIRGGKVRRKATWIIPGILVTLLLGLLWALPTMAAPSGADRGEIEFLDAAGGDSVSYASPFSDNKTIYVQVSDEDENAVIKRVGDKRLRAPISGNASDSYYCQTVT